MTIATRGVVVDRAVEVDQLAVDLRRERGLGQAPPDASRRPRPPVTPGAYSRVEPSGSVIVTAHAVEVTGGSRSGDDSR